jgi:general secretion pathway protein J
MTPPRSGFAAPPQGGTASGLAKPVPRRSLGSGPRRLRGFTLAEVLVALALMALLASLSWQGIASVADAKRSSDQRVEGTLRAGTVLAQWEQDLSRLHDTPLVPALAFDGATLRLVRRQEGGLQVVAWALREGRWTRWASPVVARATALQEAWIESQQLLGNEPNQLVLWEGLAAWQVYFFRGSAWSNAQSSGDVAAAPAPGASAPGPLRVQLPTGVRVVLTLRTAEGQTASTLTRDLLLAPQGS